MLTALYTLRAFDVVGVSEFFSSELAFKELPRGSMLEKRPESLLQRFQAWAKAGTACHGVVIAVGSGSPRRGW